MPLRRRLEAAERTGMRHCFGKYLKIRVCCCYFKTYVKADRLNQRHILRFGKCSSDFDSNGRH